MIAPVHSTCPFCEAMCGLVVERRGDGSLRVCGDADDPFSRGHVCVKAAALIDLHDDRDRLRQPLQRRGGGWTEIAWEQALNQAAEGIREVQRGYGRDAVAAYVGNPIVADYGALLFGMILLAVLRTRNVFTSNSVDALPRLLVSYLLYGSWALAPIPDLDRTDFMLIIGANPVVSNGSVMSAPGCRRRLRAIRDRGGKLVVIDPRRTETANVADVHHFIRPGSDALLLLALLHVVFAERLANPGRVGAFVEGIDCVRELAAGFPPDKVAPAVGIGAGDIADLAIAFARARSAVCYGRMGTSTQEFGTLSTWLIDVLNIVTGNLDRCGGAMFARPAVDVAGVAALLGQSGAFDRWRSRVRSLPEFNGELPVAALAEEIETPGEGQIRCLLTCAGNPVLSTPNGRRLERALTGLRFMIAVDPYLNETSRYADLILPPTVGLERDYYGLIYHAFGTRNTAKYGAAVLTASGAVKDDWWIARELACRLLSRSHLVRFLAKPLTPRTLLRVLLRLGPHGAGLNPFGRGLSLAALEKAPHGVDLGPLTPRLPEALRTPAKKIRLAPEALVGDVQRLRSWLRERKDEPAGRTPADRLLLVGRREVRTNNSWMHNSPRLMKGGDRCTLLMHPEDAVRRGIGDGQVVTVRSRVGSVEVQARITMEIMPGVVSLPHGWGHGREGVRLRVAQQLPGVSANDVTDEALIDRLSGCSVLNGVPVTVSPAAPVAVQS